MNLLKFAHNNFEDFAISPFLELGAYESLWLGKDLNTFKRISDKFSKRPDTLPSDFVDKDEALSFAKEVDELLKRAGVLKYGVRVHGAGDYPQSLRDADHPVELLYYQGWWDLINSPRSIAIVGSRHPSEDGIKRTRQLVRRLVSDNFTIVSGLAQGIDTAAHRTAIDCGGKTIAVIGTPLSRAYPKENATLQKEIAENFLIISQVPVKRYEATKDPRSNRHFFPERNVTMSALTQATVIIEAGETSGTLHQARAAIKQGRKLFILDSCFKGNLKWPHKFAEKGAIRVKDYDDIRRHLIPA